MIEVDKVYELPQAGPARCIHIMGTEALMQPLTQKERTIYSREGAVVARFKARAHKQLWISRWATLAESLPQSYDPGEEAVGRSGRPYPVGSP